MEIRNYKHYSKSVAVLLNNRKLTWPITALPRIGFIIMDGHDPVAMGFLRRIEKSETAMVDGFVSDPSAPVELRKHALDLLTKTLIKKAKSLGIKKLIAFSAHKNTIKQAQILYEFEKLPSEYDVLGLDLTK